MHNMVREAESIKPPIIGPRQRPGSARTRSKKDRILHLYRAGMTNVAELAVAVHSRPGYVAHVLTEAGLLSGYFDLYTSTAQLMNFHSYFSRGMVRFRTPEAARASVERIADLYREFESRGDRAGQHHAEVIALIGTNRARSCGKIEEARIFADWLIERLKEV
jgi:hypothetical protein